MVIQTLTHHASPGLALSGLIERLESVSFLSWPLVRITAGLLLVPHGAQKLFGWFGGFGPAATGGFFADKLGLEPGILFAVAAGAIEFAGGLLLALGLFTRPVALAVAALMAVAVFQVHLGAGFFWTSGGYEYPLLWGVVALALAIRGGGELSLDRKFGLPI